MNSLTAKVMRDSIYPFASRITHYVSDQAK